MSKSWKATDGNEQVHTCILRSLEHYYGAIVKIDAYICETNTNVCFPLLNFTAYLQ